MLLVTLMCGPPYPRSCHTLRRDQGDQFFALEKNKSGTFSGPPTTLWLAVFSRNRYRCQKYLYQVDFWGTRGSKPADLRAHSWTVFGLKSPQKIYFGDFHAPGWKSGFRGLSGRFSEWSRVPISIFSGRLGIRERRRLSLGPRLAKLIHTKNSPGQIDFPGDRHQ